MDDRALLEAAAKAAGIEGHFENDGKNAGLFLHSSQGSVWKRWHPLEDDGDALRLAVKLELWIRYRDGGPINVCWYDGSGFFAGNVSEHLAEGPYAATRRAIVRAAAAIGASTGSEPAKGEQ